MGIRGRPFSGGSSSSGPAGARNAANGYVGIDANGNVDIRFVPRSGTLATIQGLYPATEPADGEQFYITNLGVTGLWNATTHTIDYYSSRIWDHVSAYWPLQEPSGTRKDNTGNGSTLTDNNTVTSEPGVCGPRAVFLIANSESLSIANNTNLQSGDIHYALVFLINFSALPSFSRTWWKGAGYNGTTTPEWGLNASSTTSMEWYVTTGAAVAVATHTLTLATATDYFVIAIHDPIANTIRLSVTPLSAASVAAGGTTSHSAGILANTDALNFATDGVGNYSSFSMAEAAIIKNRPLSSAEIEHMFQNAKVGRSLFA